MKFQIESSIIKVVGTGNIGTTAISFERGRFGGL